MTEHLPAEIKHNCDVSDAAYWGYFSICGLLMRYRDLYRSEQHLEPWSPIRRQEIGIWIERKEARWPELEGQEFRRLPIAGSEVDPYAVETINTVLRDRGLAYGAGYGVYRKPTFFLAELRSVTEIEGHHIYRTERELVRDLFTAPAMLQQRTIFIRIEPLRALLWDLYSQLRPGCTSIMTDAFALYGLAAGSFSIPRDAEALARMADAYAGVLIRHELAESKESLPAWKELLAAGVDRKAELFLRAIQDLVADTSDSGPLKACVDHRDRTSLTLMVGLMERLRSSIAPEIRNAYQRFRESDDWSIIEEARCTVLERFRSVRQRALKLFDPDQPTSFGARIGTLIQEMT